MNKKVKCMDQGNKKWICVVGFVSLVLYGFLAWMSNGLPIALFGMENGFYYEVNNNDMPTEVFLIVYGVLFAIYWFVIEKIRHREQSEVNQDFGLPRRNTPRNDVWVIVWFAVVFRLVMVFGQPIHENDFYRYHWDGRSSIHGINPFKHAPSDLYMYEKGLVDDLYFPKRDITYRGVDPSEKDENRLKHLIELRDESPLFFYRIGHEQVPTIYPPVAQFVFALSSLISENNILFMKFIFVLFDLGVLGIIFLLLKHFNLNPARSIIYAWSPLVIKEFANSGHYDSVAVFWMMSAIYLFLKKRETLGSMTLAFGFLSKMFPIVLLPFFMLNRKWFQVGLIFIGTIAVCYFPFLIWSNIHPAEVFEGFNTYNAEWFYNSSLHAICYAILDFFKIENVLTISKGIMAIFYAFVWFYLLSQCSQTNSDHQLLKACFYAVAILFLINPVGDPWYYCWVLPFLCFIPRKSWLLLSGLLPLAYLNFKSDIPWVYESFLGIGILNWFVYTPFFILLFFEYLNKETCLTE